MSLYLFSLTVKIIIMKKILFILTLYAISIASNAQLLWKISDNGLDTPSYIFGTHHVASLSICDSIKGFDNAFKEAKQLYGELDMNFINDMNTVQKMQKAMMMPENIEFKSLFTDEEYQTIDKACRKYLNMSIDIMKSFKPMAIASQITVILAAKSFPGMKQEEKLDIEMQNRARKAGMAVKGLESVEFQTNLMFNIPLKTQARFLIETIESEDEAEGSCREIAEAFMKQDLERIISMIMEEEMKNNSEFIQTLLYDRNNNWVKQMKSIMKEMPTFFVVGAGHLPGDKGVITLLKKEGYKVEAVW